MFGANVSHTYRLSIRVVTDLADDECDSICGSLTSLGYATRFDPSEKPSVELLMTGRDSAACAKAHVADNSNWIVVIIAIPASGTLSLRESLFLSRAVAQYHAPAVVVFPSAPSDETRTTVTTALSLPPTSFSSQTVQFVVGSASAREELLSVLRDCLNPSELRGKLIVLEGSDGSGKQTQTALLLNSLRSEGKEAVSVDFPHDSAFCGGLVRSLLAGNHGSLSEVDPALFSSVYAMNRLATSVALRWCIYRGVTVVCDRYATANFGHQASKLEGDAGRELLIKRLAHWEFGVLGLPAPDAVFYLDLPFERAAAAMAADVASGVRDGLDIHESAGARYKAGVRAAFLWCSERYAWNVIQCMAEGSERKSREVVHAEIKARVLAC